MICLGIESTAHTFGAAVVEMNEQGKCIIHSNERHSYSTVEGGLVPKELEEHHLKFAKQVIESALEKSGKKLREASLIAFARGPGIGQALRVGAVAARALALSFEKPLLGVNHCVAHIEIGKATTGCKDPIIVYASGANTQIIGFETGYYRVFGETLDIGIGNLLDSFGRVVGIGFPAGPKLDEMYFKGKEFIELPYSVKGMDLVFSGLLTATGQKWVELSKGKSESKLEQLKNDFAFSLLHTAFAELVEVSERALAHTEKNEVLVVGGVAASKALQKMLEKMCNSRNAKAFFPELSVVVDNAVMIAWLGLLMFKAGIRQELGETRIDQRFRTDAVKVEWIE